MTRFTSSQCLLPLIPVLTHRAYRLESDRAEAEDLVQDTLLTLCQNLHDSPEISDLSAHAMQTLSHHAQQGSRLQVTETLEDDHALTQPDALLRLDCADTLAAIRKLAKPQRELMDLIVAGETSPRALADATNLPLGTVMSRLARARAKLRIALSDE